MDDLLDLSWDAANQNKPNPTQPIQPTQPPSSSSSSSFARNTSAFAAVSSSPKPNYYGSSSSSSSTFATPVQPSAASSNAASAKPTPSSTDAFSSLFAPSSSAKTNEATLSLAERHQLAQKQARQNAEAEKRRNDALWSGIDSSAFGTSASTNTQRIQATAAPAASITPINAASRSSTPLTPSMRLDSSAPINPTSSSTAKSVSNPTSNAAADPWDFDALSSAVPSKPANSASNRAPKAQTQSANDPFDFDSFDQPFSAPQVAVHTDTKHNDDDILGALAMPVSEASKNSLSAQDPRIAALSRSASSASSSADSSRVPSPAHGSRPTASSHARTSSPPPHIIGQIVEMGFSSQEARHALAQTDTGVNVEAALERLVGGAQSGRSPGDTQQDERLARKLQAQEYSQSQSGRFQDSDDEDVAPASRQPRRRQPSNQRNTDPRAQADGQAGANWQQQADQIYAQASEIGTSVLNKASAFWSSAKAQAQKALDERNRAGGERSTTPSDTGSERHRARRWGGAAASARTSEWQGKPKWMVEAEMAEAEQAGAVFNGASAPAAEESAEVGGFKDSDDEDEAAAQQQPQAQASGAPRQPAAPSATAGGVAATAAAMSSAASALFAKAQDVTKPAQTPAVPARPAAAPKAAYASPNRRGPSRSAAATPPVAKAPLKRRPIPSDASHTISSANRNKQEGNEHFRRGAYGDAEASYTKGISVLESSSSESIRLVPLLSNRANARLKNGDASGTVADCDRLLVIVLSLFGGAERDGNGRVAVYPASEEAALPAELADVNLRETYGKALVRRAQALEVSEKWKLAKADWEVLLEFEKAQGSGVKTATSNMTFAREGIHRCGKMLGDKVVGPASSSAAPVRKAPSRGNPLAASGEKASTAFADQQQKQAAEESAKFALKDAVDAKIDAWKRGKETNLRALLSSLDTIVWPELGWKPIALHQVLDPASLKKNYTKAIARLHPDKIKNDAAIEHKMIASAAFHALNEAWNAQQQ